MDKIAVIGIGVVGLELSMRLARHYPVLAYDISSKRIKDFSAHFDENQLFDSKAFKKANIIFYDDIQKIKKANIFMITVPTDLTRDNQPDLGPLKAISKTLASFLKPKDIVIYQSTVFPRTTEDIMIPILEEHSGLKINQDFYAAFTPERYSPNDPDYTLAESCRVIGVSHPCIVNKVQSIYKKICDSTYIAPSMAIAECCKILENIQRNVNIALMNEFSKITHALDIPLNEVIKASSTKHNFMLYQPGLVGGYCIPVNPVYIIYQAKMHQVEPKLIEVAHQINEDMPQFIFDEFIKLYFKELEHKQNPRIGIFGLSFKPNIPDTRHSLSLKFIQLMREHGLDVLIHDPFMQAQFNCMPLEKINKLDISIILVRHQFYVDLGLNFFIKNSNTKPIIMDVAHLFDDTPKPKSLVYWGL